MSGTFVVGVGARTPLGLDAAQTSFLLRAGLPAIGESPLADPKGEPVVAGWVPVVDARCIGSERLVALARPALAEAISRIARVGGSASTGRGPRVAMGAWLCVDARMPREAGACAALEAMAEEALPGASVSIVARGGAGAVAALGEALRAMELRQIDAAVIGGAHSDHDPAEIAALSARGGLFARDNLDARIPGEAAAFFVIARGGDVSGRGLSPLAEIVGSGLAMEETGPDEEAPAAAAVGLTSAIRGATESLRARGATAGWVWSDLCHEARRLREWQSAFIRSQKVLGRPYRLDSPAQRMGHLGAAALPLFVATSAIAWSRGFGPSPFALGTAFGDTGERAALLLRDPGARDEVRS